MKYPKAFGHDPRANLSIAICKTIGNKKDKNIGTGCGVRTHASFETAKLIKEGVLECGALDHSAKPAVFVVDDVLMRRLYINALSKILEKRIMNKSEGLTSSLAPRSY